MLTYAGADTLEQLRALWAAAHAAVATDRRFAGNAPPVKLSPGQHFVRPLTHQHITYGTPWSQELEQLLERWDAAHECVATPPLREAPCRRWSIGRAGASTTPRAMQLTPGGKGLGLGTRELTPGTRSPASRFERSSAAPAGKGRPVCNPGPKCQEKRAAGQPTAAAAAAAAAAAGGLPVMYCPEERAIYKGI